MEEAKTKAIQESYSHAILKKPQQWVHRVHGCELKQLGSLSVYEISVSLTRPKKPFRRALYWLGKVQLDAESGELVGLKETWSKTEYDRLKSI